MQTLKNVYRLGVKELWSLYRDPIMVFLILYIFTIAIYSAATAKPDTLHMAPIAVVDEDHSQLSNRIVSAFFPPKFNHPEALSINEIDRVMDTGRYTFVIDIPPNFQRDVLAGKKTEIQLNVDATRMSQAFSGNGYIQQIINEEINEFLKGYRAPTTLQVSIVNRTRFNPNLEESWFGAIMEIINNVTMLSIILTGAALIREREHGTIEHLLVMPVTPAEIMLAKVWSMSLVVIVSTLMSVYLVVRGALDIPIHGSINLFLLGALFHLFATTSMGIFLATLARSMPQFGMLVILFLLPLEILSGGMTPRESMPEIIQDVMLFAPTTHFVSLSQAILYRGAGFDAVWPQFIALAAIGSALFALALMRFRKTISLMA
ncbi:ABC transporter permease [Thiomicrorhabdus sp.]|uniref:ABC transporter permease n=1 Tax=Thiomicrorhabdus sp. TaxID=2039724 RepID=UPI0029C7F330|nr:ABC transporter permease [Thiomicrorhabdus sp.]